MLSLSKISNSGGASTYFEIDDYYTKEEAKEIIKDSTFWHGSLVDELSIKLDLYFYKIRFA
jgi:hypothetical protein